jgi:predicted RNase H-like HicB family nuclease
MYKYSINVVWSDEDECYIATIPEFSGLSAFGDTQEDAIQEALVALEGFVEVYREDNVPLPIPKTHKPHSGQTRLRLPKSLHAILVEEAKNEGVSLNTYILNLLARRHEQNKTDTLLDKIEEIHSAVFTLCRATLASSDEPKAAYSPWVEYFQTAGQKKGKYLSERTVASTGGLTDYEFIQNFCVMNG